MLFCEMLKEQNLYNLVIIYEREQDGIKNSQNQQQNKESVKVYNCPSVAVRGGIKCKNCIREKFNNDASLFYSYLFGREFDPVDMNVITVQIILMSHWKNETVDLESWNNYVAECNAKNSVAFDKQSQIVHNS